jgi:hypothetical protein
MLANISHSVDWSASVTSADFASCSVRVCAQDPLNSVYVHPGTELADPTDDGGEPYALRAYVPVKERRRLSESESNAVYGKWHWPSSHCVSTFAIDTAIVADLRALGDGAEGAEGGERLWNRVCETTSLTTAGRVTCLGVSSRPSGLRTSTFDVSRNHRLGLHLDSWDRLPLARRHESRVRLCMNLGWRNRSLLFLPYDIATITEAVEATGAQVEGAIVGSQFCRAFPDVPVLELVIPPGHAYLAPTDNLIHDGCSEPSAGLDVTIAWLGYIGYSAPLR